MLQFHVLKAEKKLASENNFDVGQSDGQTIWSEHLQNSKPLEVFHAVVSSTYQKWCKERPPYHFSTEDGARAKLAALFHSKESWASPESLLVLNNGTYDVSRWRFQQTAI